VVFFVSGTERASIACWASNEEELRDGEEELGQRVEALRVKGNKTLVNFRLQDDLLAGELRCGIAGIVRTSSLTDASSVRTAPASASDPHHSIALN
jgi:hypothetical protein